MTTFVEVDYLRSRAVEYIQRPVLRMPYSYGGNDSFGMDCSGIVVETLQSVGLIKNNEDYSAHGLYLKFKAGRIVELTKERPYLPHGCLVFWFKNGKAYHVAMAINDFQICEAAGGGENTITEEDAKRDNAYVRIRRLNYRGTNYKIVDPFEGWDLNEH